MMNLRHPLFVCSQSLAALLIALQISACAVATKNETASEPAKVAPIDPTAAPTTRTRRGEGEDAQTMHLQMTTSPDAASGPPHIPPGLDLDGWFLPEEAVAYRRLASQVHDGILVELGVWKGKSMSEILDIARANRCRVFAVDLWYHHPDGGLYAGPNAPDIRGVFEQNLALLGHTGTVQLIQEDTATAAAHFADGSVDLLFVDGDHSHAGVVRDLRAWLPKLKPDGILLGHDYIWFEGVRTGVAEVLGQRFKQLEGSLWQALRPWRVLVPPGKGAILLPTFEDTDLLVQNFAGRPALSGAIDIHVFDDNAVGPENATIKALCAENGWHYHFVGREKHADWRSESHDLSGFNRMLWQAFTQLGRDYDYVLKLDTDAYAVEPDFFLEFDRLLTGELAIAGSAETRPTGDLQALWSLLRAHGYAAAPGPWTTHMQGGIYGFSKAALAKLEAMGFLEGVHDGFAEDPYLSACCTALGIPFREVDHSGSWWYHNRPPMERLRHLKAVHPMTRAEWQNWQAATAGVESQF